MRYRLVLFFYSMLFSAAACAVTTTAGPAKLPLLHWCLDHFPGFHEFPGDSRSPVGPSVEMMQELARRAGLTLQTGTKTPASRCVKDLLEGKTDIMTNLLYSKERADKITLIRFGSRFPDRLYLAATDSRRTSDVTQLSSLSIVTVRGFGLHPALQQVVNALPAAQKQQVLSTEIALQMVARGRADATLLPPTQVNQIYRQQPALAGQLRDVSFASEKVRPQDIYLGLSKSLPDPAVEARLRQALKSMQQDGSMRRIFAGKIIE